MNKSAQIFIGVTAVVVVILTALIYSKTPLPGEVEKTRQPEKATLAYVTTTPAVLAGIALHQGYYRQEGLEITARPHTFGKAALEDMLEGSADFATAAESSIMMAIMKGESISILATIQTSNRCNAIVARIDSGILRPEDLKGKKIATTPGAPPDFFMDAYLSRHGIAREEYERVDLEPESLQDALVSGQVDAVSVCQPFLIQMEKKLGDRVVSFYDENIYTWTFNVVAKQEFVRNNPEKAKKLLRALVLAEEFVKEDPDEAQKIVADNSGMDPSLVGEIWPNMKFNVTLNQFLVLALEDESRWAIDSGIIAKKKIPNFLDYIYFDGLEAVKPKAVRMLR
ncbi:MAG: hypothetical protein VR65_25780 [Desulfobulbaceae bacterium BRH_c16a]|nr:MAG: hypothetical protein VR65_25780 [Desulfobulbaceae bacterium BRH_c16a]